jgi:hypothetical protein
MALHQHFQRLDVIEHLDEPNHISCDAMLLHE